VRKPFMILGTAISLVGGTLFALSVTEPDTSYYTIAVYFILSAAGGGMAYVAWMASFTETVERHNPAATATGLAIWGWILRIVVTASLAVLTLVVPATSILVDQGSRVSEIVEAHPEDVAVLSAIPPETAAALDADPTDVDALATALGAVAREVGAPDADAEAVSAAVRTRAPQLAAVQAIAPETFSALQNNPFDQAAQAAAVGDIMQGLGVNQQQAVQLLTSLASPDVQDDLGQILSYANLLTTAQSAIPAEDLAYLSEHGEEVAAAQQDNPEQWQRWWWVCVAGQVLFLPFVFVLSGRWSPRRAKQDELEHEQRVSDELATLQGTRS
jgi:ACS family D-galactonate transporter-like MFS transporter